MNEEYDEYIRPGTRESMFAALDLVPDRALDVLQSLRSGRVNGAQYYGSCACLIGMLSGVTSDCFDAHQARSKMIACGLREVHDGYTDTPAHIIPAERLFLTVWPGDTPSNNKYCRYAEDCITDWMRLRGKSGPEEGGGAE